MNELILPPEPRRPNGESGPKPTIEIVIDPSEARRERKRSRYDLTSTLLSVALLAGIGAYAFHFVQDSSAPKQVAAPAQPSQAALHEETQRQISALQTEVRDLRAKLEAAEKRPPAAPEALSVTPAAKPEALTPAAQDAAEATQPRAPRIQQARPEAPEAPPVQKVAPSPRIVGGYKLREAFRSNAIVESRRGVIDIQPGDMLPGAGRVLAIEKRAGRWVVATENGDIVSDTRIEMRAPAPRRRPMMRDRYGYEPGPLAPPMFMPF